MGDRSNSITIENSNPDTVYIISDVIIVEDEDAVRPASTISPQLFENDYNNDFPPEQSGGTSAENPVVEAPQTVNQLTENLLSGDSSHNIHEIAGASAPGCVPEVRKSTRTTSTLTEHILSQDAGDELPVKKRKVEDLNASDLPDDDEGKLCPICLDSWTTSGVHRLCSLKCGHLFGHSCIKRWCKSQKTCPSCKTKVSRSEIRFIYAKKLIALDTSELEKVKEDLELVTKEKNHLHIELTKAMCKNQMLSNQISELQKRWDEIDNKKPPSQSSSSVRETRLRCDKTIDISRDGGCRVLDFNRKSNLIVVSTKSPNSLFSGYGIRKINFATYRTDAFIPLHSKQIRDVAFHHQNDWVLTVSIDKKVKILDTGNNSQVVTVSSDYPLWSCCWDQVNPNLFFAGTQQGSVFQYDFRNLSEALHTLSVEGDMSPVISLAGVTASSGFSLSQGGLLCCKLNSCWAYENHNGEFRKSSLPLEGPFVSMCFDNVTRLMLVSSRPNQRFLYSRHTLCTVENGPQETLVYNQVHCFQGGSTQKLLSRSCQARSGNDMHVVAYHETHRSVYVWSSLNGKKVSSLLSHEPVIDLRSVCSDSGYYLASLTEKKLDIYKFET